MPERYERIAVEEGFVIPEIAELRQRNMPPGRKPNPFMHETFRALIRKVPEGNLRNDHDKSADTAWAVGSIDVFLLLRTILDWDAPRYAEWLRETFHDQLVAPVS